MGGDYSYRIRRLLVFVFGSLVIFEVNLLAWIIYKIDLDFLKLFIGTSRKLKISRSLRTICTVITDFIQSPLPRKKNQFRWRIKLDYFN